MRSNCSALISSMILIVLPWSMAWGDDIPPSQTPAAPTAITPSNGTSPSTPVKKNRYQKSKLTLDESEALADKRRLLLTTGEDKAVDLEFDVNGGANGISYGNPQIVTTTLVKIGEKRQLIFKPLKSGETNVTVRDNDGTIRLIFFVRITGSDLLRTAGEIRNLLRDVEGLDIRIVGSKIVVEGEVLVPSDYGRLLSVIQDKTYSDLVIPLAVLSPMAIQVMAKKIEKDIKGIAKDVTTRVLNGMILLEGTVESKDVADRVDRIADLYLPDLRPGSLLEKDPTVLRHPPRKLINNLIVINPSPPKKQDKLIRVTVHFVELSKNYNKTFSFMWQPAYTENSQINIGQGQNGQIAGAGGGAAQGGTGSGFSFGATISSLIPKLDSMQAAGYGRIIKTGTVIVRNREAAKLVEQTEFPITQLSANGQATSASKPVGLTIAVTPSVIGQTDDIELMIDFNQSVVSGRAPTAGGSPLTAVHAVKTNIFIKSNESAAIAGIDSSTIGTDFNKDPPYNASYEPGSGTSALFTLMRSKSYTKDKSQFVVFVTPQIIENASEGTEDLKKNFRVKAK